MVLSTGNFAHVWSEKDASNVTRIFYSVTDKDGADVIAPMELAISTDLSGSYELGNARIEQLSDGNLLVSWIVANTGTVSRQVLAKVISADGSSVENAFDVTDEAGRQNVADSIEFADGNIFTVFRSDSNGWQVEGQLYNFTTGRIGSVETINNTASGDQLDPSIKKLVTTDGSEKFVVTYSSDSGDSDEWGILGKIYSYSGGSFTVEKDEFTVNTTTASWQRNGEGEHLVATSDGGFAIAYKSFDQANNNNQKILLQRFDKDGVKVGSETTVYDAGADFTTLASITELNNGDLAVLYIKAPADRSNHDLYVTIIDPNGSSVYDEVIVHSVTEGDQGWNSNGSWNHPTLSTTANGGLVITYMGETATGGSSIMQTFLAQVIYIAFHLVLTI